MRFWTLFLSRMMSRLGLAAVVTLAVVGQWEPVAGSERRMSLGGLYVSTTLTGESVCLHRDTQCAPSVSGLRSYLAGPPDVQMPGFSVWISQSLSWSVVLVDHWLLCLTFFTTTIATSVRWKKRLTKGVHDGQ